MTEPPKPPPSPLAVIEHELSRRRSRYDALLKPLGVDADFFVQSAVAHLGRPNADNLRQIALDGSHGQASFFAAIMHSARLGILPHGPGCPGMHLMQAWDSNLRSNLIVPVVDYRAELALAIEAGVVQGGDFSAVYSEDHFVFRRHPFTFEHWWDLDKPPGERGEFRGVYAHCSVERGPPLVGWMNRAELDEFAQTFASNKDGGLRGNWGKGGHARRIMELKTVLKQALRLAPRKPIAQRLAMAMALDGKAAPPETGAAAVIDVQAQDAPADSGFGAATRSALGVSKEKPKPEPEPEPEPEPAVDDDPEPEPAPPPADEAEEEAPEKRAPPPGPAAPPPAPQPPTFEQAAAHVPVSGIYSEKGSKGPLPLDAIQDGSYLVWLARGGNSSTAPIDVDMARVYVNDPGIAESLDEGDGAGA